MATIRLRLPNFAHALPVQPRQQNEFRAWRDLQFKIRITNKTEDASFQGFRFSLKCCQSSVFIFCSLSRKRLRSLAHLSPKTLQPSSQSVFSPMNPLHLVKFNEVCKIFFAISYTKSLPSESVTSKHEDIFIKNMVKGRVKCDSIILQRFLNNFFILLSPKWLGIESIFILQSSVGGILRKLCNYLNQLTYKLRTQIKRNLKYLFSHLRHL